jgi:hypothetical protein
MGSSAAHDLNNLLAKIMGSAELALDTAMDEAARDELRRILGFAQSGVAMVRRLDATTRGEERPA